MRERAGGGAESRPMFEIEISTMSVTARWAGGAPCYACSASEAHTSAILTYLTCPTSGPLRAGLITSLLTASVCSALNQAAATPGLFQGQRLTAA